MLTEVAVFAVRVKPPAKRVAIEVDREVNESRNTHRGGRVWVESVGVSLVSPPIERRDVCNNRRHYGSNVAVHIVKVRMLFRHRLQFFGKYCSVRKRKSEETTRI